jgi:hypothetical protein
LETYAISNPVVAIGHIMMTQRKHFCAYYPTCK